MSIQIESFSLVINASGRNLYVELRYDMRALIRSVSIVMGNAVAIFFIAAISAYLLVVGANNIGESFVSNGVLVGLFPIILFALSRYYQSGVTARLNNIAKSMMKGTDQIKDTLYGGIKDAVSSSKYVPIMILAAAIFSSLVLVPNIIGGELAMDSSTRDKVFGSLMISAEILLSSFMLKELFDKKKALS